MRLVPLPLRGSVGDLQRVNFDGEEPRVEFVAVVVGVERVRDILEGRAGGARDVRA